MDLDLLEEMKRGWAELEREQEEVKRGIKSLMRKQPESVASEEPLMADRVRGVRYNPQPHIDEFEALHDKFDDHARKKATEEVKKQ